MDVDSKGYGDCKALSNYTKALLQCIGITSYYTEIGAGEYQEIKFTDFASANQTDHIILCVPMDSDTIWLECTNQNIPFGFLPPGCQNRYALLVKPTGGELVKTPSFSAKENSRISSIDLDVKKCGEIDFAISTEYNNNLYGQVFPLIHASQKEQKEYLLKHLSSSNNVDIKKILISDNSGDTAKATIYTEGKLINFTSLAGSMILLAPEFFHQNDFLDFIPANRTLDIFEPFGFSYSDTLRISFPADYSLDYLQKGKQFSSVFGQCEFDVEHKENTITLIRKLSINQGQYSRSAFKEINEFLRNISDYQNKKIVLSKK
ncbi:MAG: hypothetical protein IPH45_14920 [Bacteroidales bacterium]|nr:hypothetical protein [Bacteroidales bacterium]